MPSGLPPSKAAAKTVGVNIFTESVPSALMHAADGGFLAIDADAERIQIERPSLA